jgi:hypothetical protein
MDDLFLNKRVFVDAQEAGKHMQIQKSDSIGIEVGIR